MSQLSARRSRSRSGYHRTGLAALALLLVSSHSPAAAGPDGDAPAISDVPAEATADHADLELALGQLLALVAAEPDSIDPVLCIETEILAEEAEDLTVWGEWDLARELIVEAVRVLLEADVTLPASLRDVAGVPPVTAQPAEGGTAASDSSGS